MGAARAPRRAHTLLIGCLLLPLFAVPVVAYAAASQSVAGIVLLSMLAVAVHGFVRFTVNRDTEAGFLTGLALAAAFAVDPIAIGASRRTARSSEPMRRECRSPERAAGRPWCQSAVVAVVAVNWAES